jgi:hypothetical protein
MRSMHLCWLQNSFSLSGLPRARWELIVFARLRSRAFRASGKSRRAPNRELHFLSCISQSQNERFSSVTRMILSRRATSTRRTVTVFLPDPRCVVIKPRRVELFPGWSTSGKVDKLKAEVKIQKVNNRGKSRNSGEKLGPKVLSVGVRSEISRCAPGC